MDKLYESSELSAVENLTNKSKSIFITFSYAKASTDLLFEYFGIQFFEKNNLDYIIVLREPLKIPFRGSLYLYSLFRIKTVK